MNGYMPEPEEFKRGIEAWEEHEARSSMYKVTRFLISNFWGNPSDMAEALGVLLETWNQAFYRYGSLDHSKLENCLKENLQELGKFRKRNIEGLKDSDEQKVKTLFEEFMEATKIPENEKRSPVATSKALHSLAPSFFPLWDEAIAEGYDCKYNRDPSGAYILFCKRMEIVVNEVKDYDFGEKHEIKFESGFKEEKSLLKLIDQYNYSKYTKGWI